MLETVIEEKIRSNLNISFLRIENESYKHHGPADAETHFRIELVSSDFRGKSMVACHQLIYRILSDELKTQIHALSLGNSHTACRVWANSRLRSP